MGNPNFLSANASGIELMPGVNDDAVGYDVNRIIQALNGTNIVPITTGDLTVTGNETISGTLRVTGLTTLIGGLSMANETIVGPITINPGPLTVSNGGIAVTGNSTITGNLHVTGTSALDGLITAGAGIGVTGGTTTDTLSVSGASTLTGPLTASATTNYFWDDFEEAGTGSLVFGNAKPGGMGNIVTAWHSLGTEAGTDNSIAYWDTAINGAWSFASHIASPAANNDSILIGGHADWDATVGIQVQARIAAARVGGAVGICVQSSGDGYYVVIDSTTAVDLYKRVSGVFTLLSSLTVPAFTLGNPLWINVQKLGGLVGWLVAPDSSGVPGTWTQSGGFNDTTFTKGRVAIRSNHSLSDTTFGGAFNNVFVVKTPGPFNGALWTPVVVQGEPAFAWSDQSFNSGTRSLSIYNATNNGQGYWTMAPSPALPSGTYTLSGSSRAVTGATPSNFYVGQSNSVLVTTNPGTVDNNWHSYTATGACTVNNMFALAYGLGTYYFDTISTRLGNYIPNGLVVGNDLWASAGITSQGPISIAPVLNGTPAASSYGSLPIKFAEVVADANANNVITIDHIPAWGRKIKLIVMGRSDTNAVNTNVNLRFNGDVIATDYTGQLTYFAGAAANTDTTVENINNSALQIGYQTAATSPSDFFNPTELEIYNYTDTSHNKFCLGRFSFSNANLTGQFGHGVIYGIWHPATIQAINRIDVILSAGNWVAGSVITVYIYP